MSDRQEFRVDYMDRSYEAAASSTHYSEADARKVAEAFVSAGSPDTRRTAYVSRPVATYYMRHAVSSLEYTTIPDIANLTPQDAPLTAAVAEPEIPAGFTKWERGGQPSPFDLYTCETPVIGWMGGDDFVGPIPAKDFDWTHDKDPVLAYKIVSSGSSVVASSVGDVRNEFLASSPAGVEESRDQLLTAFEDDHIVDPSLPIDVQTCEPVDPRVSGDDGPRPEDTSILNDPDLIAGVERAQATLDLYSPEEDRAIADAYIAQVTNPAADEAAAAHDYYSPEAKAKRDRFNPFGMFHKRETEEV